MNVNRISLLIFSLLFFAGCDSDNHLYSVTTNDFSEFVESTGYITDAEKYGWSVQQIDVFNFRTVEDATWRYPDGKNPAIGEFPVTQVSYNDAIAYCNWAGVRLPEYNEYWILAKKDYRPIHINTVSLKSSETVNHVGNTWDITKTWNKHNEIRLAGGSYLCNKRTCDGTNRNRELYVSPDTGNTNISFVVIE